MADFRIDVRGLKELRKDLRSAFNRIEDTRPMMAEIALLLDKDSKQILLGPRSGRDYFPVRNPRVSDPKWPRRIRYHKASKEGEPPANDRGDLRSSVQFNSSKTQAVVGSNLKYASILESPSGLNRPWLATVNKRSIPGIQKIINRHLESFGDG